MRNKVRLRLVLGELKWDGVDGGYMITDRKETFFVLPEQTPSERQRIQPDPQAARL